MPQVVWVTLLRISPGVSVKLNAKHSLTAQDVRESVERVKGLRAAEDHHPVHGYRLLLKVTIRGGLYLLWLQPTDDATVFNLRTCYGA